LIHTAALGRLLPRCVFLPACAGFLLDQYHYRNLFKQDIQAAIEEVLLVEPGTANIMTEAIYKKLQSVWGGEKVYIQAPNNATRNEQIKKEFNGRNHGDICKKYKITLRTLYRTIKN